MNGPLVSVSSSGRSRFPAEVAGSPGEVALNEGERPTHSFLVLLGIRLQTGLRTSEKIKWQYLLAGSRCPLKQSVSSIAWRCVEIPTTA